MLTPLELCNETGLRLAVLPFGATLCSLQVPVGNGRREVLLGCAPADYPRQQGWLGAVAGRFANRIGGAYLAYGGEAWWLDANQAPHCLHGGRDGFHRRPWQRLAQEADRLRLGLLSPDGDQGFPGRLEVQLEYRLEGWELVVEFRAQCDKPTPVSLTSHAYFNLDGGGDVRDHRLLLRADHYLPSRPDGIPLAPAPVQGVFDLRRGRRLGRDWLSHPQQAQAGGYDHCFLNHGEGQDWLARLESSDGRLAMEVITNQPSLQLYSGNGLGGTPDRNGGHYADHAGLCLEAQQVPDSPNRPELGNPWLLPGDSYHHLTHYRFIPL